MVFKFALEAGKIFNEVGPWMWVDSGLRVLLWFVHQIWYLTETSSNVRPVWVGDRGVLSGQPVGDSAVCA